MPTAASGVSRPSANSTPLVSPSPASTAIASGARNPIPPKKPAVPRGPPPPNQPKSFCVPCEASVAPATTRNSKMPYDMPSTSLRAVVFDVDFTLAMPGPELGPEGYCAVGARHGLELDPDQYEHARVAALETLERHPELDHDEEIWVLF